MIRSQKNRRLGMTTIEVTVSLFVGTMVLGLLYHCFELTQKRSNSQTLESGAISEALKLSDEIDKIIGNAIEPKTLGDNWSKAKRPEYEKKLLGLYSTATVKSGPACARFTIDNQKAENEETGTRIRIQQTNLNDANTTQPLQSSLTVGDSDYYSSIEFFYADDFDKNLNAEIKKRAGKNPTYLRYQISIVDKLGRMRKPVIIVSGVALP